MLTPPYSYEADALARGCRLAGFRVDCSERWFDCLSLPYDSWNDERMRKRSFHVTMAATLWLAQMASVSAHAQDAKQLSRADLRDVSRDGRAGDGPTSQSLLPKPADLTVAAKDKSDASPHQASPREDRAWASRPHAFVQGHFEREASPERGSVREGASSVKSCISLDCTQRALIRGARSWARHDSISRRQRRVHAIQPSDLVLACRSVMYSA